MVTVRLIDLATESDALRDLRMQVLYPGLPNEKSFYAGDENGAHIGAFDSGGTLIGIASLFQRDDGSWQLRGMATGAEARGTGAGRDIVRFAEYYTNAIRAPRLWCNARVSAMGFYAKCGWRVEGDAIDVPDIGPHYVMVSAARSDQTGATG